MLKIDLVSVVLQTSFAGRDAPVGAILLTDRMYMLILQLEMFSAHTILGLVLENQVRRFTVDTLKPLTTNTHAIPLSPKISMWHHGR
jgi:hypothetical protein